MWTADLLGAEAIDAQGIDLQRARCKTGYGPHVSTLVLAAFLLMARGSCRAGGGDDGSVLTGVVRDAHGVVQMGVLVQVLAPGLGAVGSAFTDQYGRYTIAHLAAGRYRVRATASLFAPATRPIVEAGSGARTIVNLTMAALFDTASWLPAERRHPDEPEDDWKWTLRSPADRPILRLAGDQPGSGKPMPPAAEQSARRPLHGAVTLISAKGGLGEDEFQDSLLLEQQLLNGTVATVHLVGSQPTGAADASFALERKGAYGGGIRTRARFVSAPALRPGSGEQGIEAFSLASAQQAALGEWIVMEAGGEVEAIHSGSETLLAAHPFLRLTAKPGGNWEIQYRLATERGMQQYADSRADQDGIATSSPGAQAWVSHDAGQAIRRETGQHQELSVAHDLPAGRVEVGYYRDQLHNVMLSGVRSGGSSAIPGLLTEGGVNGFAVLADGYSTNGARVSYTAPLPEGVWIVAEYAVGDALSSPGAAARTAADGLHAVRSRPSQAALICLHGRLHEAGTQVRASYRWQPEGDVSAVDPYAAMSEQAFLSILARQPLRFGSWVPAGLEATITVSNLLAQGYRPFLSADGQTLYLAQTPRSVQVGLAFNF